MRSIICFLLVVVPFSICAQSVPASAYPQGYFRNPLNIPILLAGNFGECRPGHFHSGLDIKTLGREDQPVHAAAEGYISRIKMDKGGFGHALYITHPNGYTTLYAHLNDFSPAIQKYLRHEQYKQKRWNVDLQLNATQFPVRQGDKISFSGNTGASTAPHLHFEIRNTKTEHPLNPQLFGLQVVDNIPPAPAEVAIYNLDRSLYEQSPVLVTLRKQGTGYGVLRSDNKDYPVTNDTVDVEAFGTIGFGVNVDDHMEGSDNTITFLHASLYIDDSLDTEIQLDNIGYDETRYINAYIDYKTKKQQGKWIQCFFKLPGNRLDNIYSNRHAGYGAFNNNDRRPRKVRISLTDDRGNKTDITFYTKRSGNFVTPPNGGVFANRFKPNETNRFSNDHITFTLDDRQLYDSFYFVYDDTDDHRGISVHSSIHYPYVPIHHYFDMKIKTDTEIPESLKSKVVMVYSDGKDEDGRAAVPIDSGWYKAAVRNFGIYWLDIDTIPPVIESMQRKVSNLSSAKRISFSIKDNLTSVKTFSGYLDDKWICFEQHGDDFFYRFDEHCAKGKHKLVFKAEDEKGNTSTYELKFTR